MLKIKISAFRESETVQISASRLRELLVSPQSAAFAAVGVAGLCATITLLPSNVPSDAPEVKIIEGTPSFKPVTLTRESTPELTPSKSFFDDQASLARALQQELARLGCYEGPINGQWTSRSRKAMVRLIEKVNARLPAEKPDAVLLALARGESEGACDRRTQVAELPHRQASIVSTDLGKREEPISAEARVGAPPRPALEETAYEPQEDPSPERQIESHVAAAPVVAAATPIAASAPIATRSVPYPEREYRATKPERRKSSLARKRHKGPSFAKSFRSFKWTLKWLF